MKIVQINTYDIQGGAARAAYRLHKGLREIGEDCRMLVRYKASSDDSVYRIDARKDSAKLDEEFYLDQIQHCYIDRHRTDLSNTIFSLPYPGYDLSESALVQAADIINLHWVAWYQSLTTLHGLFSLGKPVVWTLHDQWAFTGGCHYSAGCDKYIRDCSSCPQLADDPFDLSAAILKDKIELFKNVNLTVVTPSKWLAGCAGVSRLFKNVRVEVIPNSLEVDVFMPVPKAEAKQRLSLPEDTITLLFGAHSGEEKRKGFGELIGAITYCKSHPEFQKLLDENKITVLCFGYPAKELTTIGIPIISLGYLDSEERVRDAYAASDMFILPSLEDNLPNTMLEALSCGTPVVAFDVGGIPDVVKDDVNGKLAPVKDTRLLAEAILDLILNPEKSAAMGKNGRKQIRDDYKLRVQAQHYTALYKEVLDTTTKLQHDEIRHDNLDDVDKTVSAALYTSIGIHFKDIYEQVLFKSLKESAPTLQRKWQECEADRAARLDIIKRVNEQLEICEKDRAARLDVINALDAQVKGLQRFRRGGS
jgi:glycosyltransferase involved in cell wall biosynthesis